MSKFYKLRVRDVVRETADAVSFGFDVPRDLADEYRYIQGQYLTLRFFFDGEEVRRSYSICSSPLEPGLLRVAVKRVAGGKVSNHINESLVVADEIDVMTPDGRFYTDIAASNEKTYVLFAGGSGVTPMMSILKTVLLGEPKSNVILFYGNNDEASIIFRKEIDSLEAEYSSRFVVKHILATAPAEYPELLSGLMTKEKNSALVREFVTGGHEKEYFICGPVPMMDNVVAALKALNVDPQNVHVEYFSAPVAAPETKTDAPVIYNGAHLIVTMDGDEYETTMLPDEAILFAAKRIGLDAPYSCQNGSCSTCRAKLISGKVHMKVNFALNAADVASGFILSCQSMPLTSDVEVSYDEAM